MHQLYERVDAWIGGTRTVRVDKRRGNVMITSSMGSGWKRGKVKKWKRREGGAGGMESIRPSHGGGRQKPGRCVEGRQEELGRYR